MNRRSLVALPGIVAFAASRAFGESEVEAPAGVALHASRKALAKAGGAKAAYELPKNANKQAKYVSSLTALLTLSPAQKQQATTIFTNAVNNRIGIHATMKSLRKVLKTAVQNNDGSGIQQASTEMGSLMAQYVLNGAQANSSFYQVLTPAQQSLFAQFQGNQSTSTNLA